MARRKASAKRGPSFAKRLVIMAKRPDMGRVKRRLAREIGASAAIRFYRSSPLPHRAPPCRRSALADGARGRFSGRSARCASFAEAARADAARRWRSRPAHAAPVHAAAAGSCRHCRQRHSVDPPGPYCRGVQAARRRRRRFRAGAGRRLLAGRTKAHPARAGALCRVRWSGPHALADTLANLKGKRVAIAARLSDVDTAEDLRRERGRAGRLI